MKLSKKNFAMIGLVWLFFSSIIILDSQTAILHSFAVRFIFECVLFPLGIFWAIRISLIKRMEAHTEELQKSNTQLGKEIADREAIEKELLTHKEHLVHMAHYDGLTSLPNRIFFNELLNKSLEHAKKFNRQLAVLFIDIDRFKKINDAYDHTVGDLVLKEVAIRFRAALKTDDILARLGGDEFIALLNDLEHVDTASNVAKKILDTCAHPIIIENHEFFVTASIGICIYPNDGSCLEDLQKNADRAMYKAKKSGGSVHQHFTHEMQVEAHKHLKLETALRKALQNNEFTLYYQPKYQLTNGHIIGVEALLRWESPVYGLMNPSEFIPLAEETGLIMPLGEWALREACKMNKTWQLSGYQPISVAVNLSAKQFCHQDISTIVASALADSGLAPQYLELEITETAVMEDTNATIHKLNDINSMGVKIALDDFGTGYTSINYLKQYPISILKIDQIFIKGIPHSDDDNAITSAVIALAHNLEMKVVAEGVETEAQMKYLADHDCDIVQGYYLSRPLPQQKLILQLRPMSESANEAV